MRLYVSSKARFGIWESFSSFVIRAGSIFNRSSISIDMRLASSRSTDEPPSSISQAKFRKKDLELLSKMAQEHSVDDKLIQVIRDTYLSME